MRTSKFALSPPHRPPHQPKMRICSFAFVASYARLTRGTTSLETPSSTISDDNLPTSIYSSDTNTSVTIDRLSGTDEATTDEERAEFESIVEELHKAINRLISVAQRADPILPTHSAYINKKLQLYDGEAVWRYLETLGWKPDLLLRKVKAATESAHDPGGMLEEAREQLRAHHVRIFESEKTREKMKTFELHPDRLFTMLVGAGERPGVKGGHLTKTFVSQNLDFMDAYIKGYNWRHHTKYTLLGTFKRCIDDPAELASFLSIAKRNSVYGLPAKRMQQELFAEWQYDSMTIDQIVGMMWRPAEITGVFAYQFLDTLIGYTSFCNMNQPDLQVFTVRLLRKHLGDSQLYMLTERAKEVDYPFYSDLELKLFWQSLEQ